ncbi:MAG TPA: CGNR zinc finger domain-containing protein [Candidatus Limnocylindria bacterium]|nr:CGNR zinc finger domain-containing protein [Candidatus Limnocylindria bacterium]
METRTHHSDIHGRHGHQAALQDGLDFVNSLDKGRAGTIDRLSDLQAVLEWLAGHDLLHHEMIQEQLRLHASEQSRERVMGQVRRVRAALRELLDATVESRPPDPAALRDVNRALRTNYVYELVPAPDGVSLDHRHEGDPIAGALARLAESIARELNEPDADRLRVCASDDCRWVFRDSSPAGRRKWCDMAVCGNRAKVARHRARQRERETA